MARPKKDPEKLKDYCYRIRLDDEHERKLNELSRYSERTRAEVFRTLVSDAYEIIFNTSDDWWFEMKCGKCKYYPERNKK